MKVEGLVFSVIAIFLGSARSSTGSLSEDPTGTTALAISVGLGLLIGGYCLLTARRMPARALRPAGRRSRGGGRGHGPFQPAAATSRSSSPAAAPWSASVSYTVGG